MVYVGFAKHDHVHIDFKHADNIASGVLGFIGAVSEGPSGSFSND